MRMLRKHAQLVLEPDLPQMLQGGVSSSPLLCGAVVLQIESTGTEEIL